jgi:nucleotide-binding universal stress UspA family protein
VKVLIALDESPVAEHAAREAVRLFSPAGADFLVISVTPFPLVWAGDGGYGTVAPLAFTPDLVEATAEDDQYVTDRAETLGITDAETHTASGDPVQLICNAADEHDVDIIVVGSHDRSALRRLFDPSVTDGVIRATHRPVLVVSLPPAE